MADFAENYVDVATRLQEFYEKYPQGSLQPLDPAKPYEIIQLKDVSLIVYAAAAYRTADDPRPGVGIAWEIVPGRTPFTRGSELMVAETSAWGRAMAALGIATRKGIASKQEVSSARGRAGVSGEGPQRPYQPKGTT